MYGCLSVCWFYVLIVLVFPLCVCVCVCLIYIFWFVCLFGFLSSAQRLTETYWLDRGLPGPEKEIRSYAQTRHTPTHPPIHPSQKRENIRMAYRNINFDSVIVIINIFGIRPARERCPVLPFHIQTLLQTQREWTAVAESLAVAAAAALGICMKPPLTRRDETRECNHCCCCCCCCCCCSRGEIYIKRTPSYGHIYLSPLDNSR